MLNSQGARDRAALIGVLVVSGLVFALIRAPFVSMPLERDEGEYAYIAQRLLQGDVPYRDAFDQKPPGVFGVYALAFVTLGESIEAIHLFLYAWSAATALFLFLLTRRLCDDVCAVFAVLAFAVSSGDPTLAATAANTEHFMIGPIVASAWALWRALDTGAARWWLATGLLAAAACWFKQVAFTNALFVAAFGAWTLWRTHRSVLPGMRALGLLFVGACLVSVPVLAVFAAVGAWDPFIDAVLWHNLEYSDQIPFALGIRILGHALGQQTPSFAVLWLLGAIALARPRALGTACWTFMLGWLLASFAGMSVGLNFRPHYFLQWLPAWSALAGAGVGLLLRQLSGSTGWVRGPAWLALGSLLVAPPVFANRTTLFAEDVAARSRRIYGSNPFPESVQIARHIERTSLPDETVYILGSEPQILFYAKRRSATRYIFFYPLTGNWPDVRRRQLDASREAEASRPRYVVWINLSTSLLLRRTDERAVFDAAREMTTRSYVLEFAAFSRRHRDPYEFLYGARGERELARVRSSGKQTAWVAVYRRRD